MRPSDTIAGEMTNIRLVCSRREFTMQTIKADRFWHRFKTVFEQWLRSVSLRRLPTTEPWRTKRAICWQFMTNITNFAIWLVVGSNVNVGLHHSIRAGRDSMFVSEIPFWGNKSIFHSSFSAFLTSRRDFIAKTNCFSFFENRKISFINIVLWTR